MVAKLGLSFIQTTESISIVLLKTKDLSFQAVIQTKDNGNWYAMDGFSSGYLDVIDPRDEVEKVPNNTFKKAFIYYNRKCAKSSLFPLTE